MKRGQTERQTDIATTRKNQPKGPFFERKKIQKKFQSPCDSFCSLWLNIGKVLASQYFTGTSLQSIVFHCSPNSPVFFTQEESQNIVL